MFLNLLFSAIGEAMDLSIRGRGFGFADWPWGLLAQQVDLSKLPSISTWKRDFTMETVLIELRRYMAAPANKKLPQPAEGTNF